MEFRDHLKKTRANLQWSDHCYFNIGLKSNKAIAKTVQAKEEFEKSDHCYHTFLSNCQQCPGVLETLDTEHHKENLNHVLLKSTEGISPKLKLNIEGLCDGISGKISNSKETLGDVSNSPEINMHGEVVSFIDILPWESITGKKHLHTRCGTFDEVEVLSFSAVDDRSENFPIGYETSDSISFTVDGGCVSEANCMYEKCHDVNTTLTVLADSAVSDDCAAAVTDNGMSESCDCAPAVADNGVSERLISDKMRGVDRCEVPSENTDSLPEEFDDQDTPRKCQGEEHNSISDGTSNRRSTMGTAEHRRKRSDHSYCETSSRKCKKAKSGKADHTYMKTSSIEELDVLKASHTNFVGNVTTHLKGSDNSGKNNSSDVLHQETVSTSQEKSPFVKKADVITPVCDSEPNSISDVPNCVPVTGFDMMPQSARTEASVGGNNEGSCQSVRDFTEACSGIGEDLASRACRTKQVLNIFGSGKISQHDKHAVEMSLDKKEVCAISVMQNLPLLIEQQKRLTSGHVTHTNCALKDERNIFELENASPFKLNDETKFGISDSRDMENVTVSQSDECVETEGLLMLSSQNEQNNDKMRCAQKATGALCMLHLRKENNSITTSETYSAETQSSANQNEAIQPTESSVCDIVQPVFVVEKDRLITGSSSIESGIPPSNSVLESVLLPSQSSAIGLSCPVVFHASNGPFHSGQFNFSPFNDATKVCDNSVQSGLNTFNTSCIPVKLSTHLPLLHNLGSENHPKKPLTVNTDGNAVDLDGHTDLTLACNVFNLSSSELCDNIIYQKERENDADEPTKCLPVETHQKLRFSVLCENAGESQSGTRMVTKHTIKKPTAPFITPVRNNRSFKMSSSLKTGVDYKQCKGFSTRRQSLEVRKSKKKSTGSSMTSPNRKLLQAVIIDHTYEEDKFLGQQVSVERDHTYGQGKMKTRKSKLRLGGTNSNVTDHNYEPLV